MHMSFQIRSVSPPSYEDSWSLLSTSISSELAPLTRSTEELREIVKEVVGEEFRKLNKMRMRIEGFQTEERFFNAVKSGDFQEVDAFLNIGMDPNISDDLGNTPLHYAAKKGRDPILLLLLRNNADINAQGKKEWRPLHYAAREGNANSVKLLLENMAENNPASHDHWTPIQLACENGRIDVVKLLVQHGVDVNHANHTGFHSLHRASGRGHANIVEYLVNEGAEVNCTNQEGITPLHEACKSGHEGIVSFLLERGADPDCRTEHQNETPLYLAYQHGHDRITHILRERMGEDPYRHSFSMAMLSRKMRILSCCSIQ